MAVWCGQCQAKNEGQADWCVRCGAALNPEAGRTAGERPARPAAAVPLPPKGAVKPRGWLYDPRWLRWLVEDQYPDRDDLCALVSKCRIAVRREAILGGAGRRVYFLPEREGAYFAAPEDTYTFNSPGKTIVLVLAKDASRAARKAVYYVESRPAPITAPPATLLAQYEQLWRDRRLCRLQMWLAPLLIAVFAVIMISLSGLGPALQASIPPGGGQYDLSLPHQLALFAVTTLAIYLALHVHRLAALLDARDRAIDELALAMGLPRLSDGRAVSLWPGSRPGATASSVLVGLMVALSLTLLWFTVRAIVASPGEITRWEPPVALALALLLYPAATLLLQWWQRLRTRRAQDELASCLHERRECSFEPWLE